MIWGHASDVTSFISEASCTAPLLTLCSFFCEIARIELYCQFKGRSMKYLLTLLLFCRVACSEEPQWYVVLDKLYFADDSGTNSVVKKLHKDSLSFFDKHYCRDSESREYFRLVDSLAPGIYSGEPEAYYSTDSLPEVHFALWLSVADSVQALLIQERYGGELTLDSLGNGPGLRGEWNILLPRVYPSDQEALAFIKVLESELGSSVGYALLTRGEYLFFGSCLEKKEADSLVELLNRYHIPVRGCRIRYQHIDI